jgi:hypothetical protein
MLVENFGNLAERDGGLGQAIVEQGSPHETEYLAR